VSRLAGAVRPVSEHLLGAGLAGLAAVPWLAVTGRVTGSVHLGVALGGAAVVSLLVTRVRRVSVATEMLVSGAVLALHLLLVVVGDPLGGSEVLRGLRDGLPRILSTGLPLLDVAWAGVPGAVAVWTATAVITATIARTRSVAWPVLAALVCFLGGYAVTVGGRTGDLADVVTTQALLLAGVAGVLTLVRRYRPVPEQDASLLATRLAGAGLTLLIAVGLGAVAAERGPFVAEEPVRPRLEPAAIELDPEGPLLVTRRLRADEPDRVVATVTVDGEWSGYVPIAVLDRYDGRVWGRSDDRLVPTGGALPVTSPRPIGPSVVVDDLDVAATGGWLPYVGRTARIEGVSVLHGAGEVFRLAEPLAQATYRLRSAQPSLTLLDEDVDADQATARTSGLVRQLAVVRRASENRPAGERVCRLLALTAVGGTVPGDDLAVRGAACGGRGPDRVGFLRAVADELVEGRAVEVDQDDGASAGGPESLVDLLDLVGPPSAEGRSTGAPEQFAAAYALVVDHYGLPARLVTGFRIEGPVAGEPHQLRGRDAWTWAEVAIDGVGWVAVDPTPSTEDASGADELARPEELEQPEARPQEAPAELGVEPETVVVGPPPPPTVSARPSWAVVAASALAALVLVPPLIAGARRTGRRRRRRRGDARARVVGAWHELLDVAHDIDVPDVESRTTEDVVATLTARRAEVAADLAALGPVVDRAVFSSRPIEDAEAVEAWVAVRRVRRELRRSLRPRTRLAIRWRVAPRSLTTGRQPRGGDAGAGARSGRRRPKGTAEPELALRT
jgi:hypothetical protein